MTILHAHWMAGLSAGSAEFDVAGAVPANPGALMALLALSGPCPFQLFCGFGPGSPETLVFDGLATHLRVDPVLWKVRVQGRDYSSLLAESSYSGSYLNQTASEIAEQIAGRHGLPSNVAPTSALVGSYGNGSFSQLLLDSHAHVNSELALLTRLATIEGYRFEIDGRILVFGPPDLVSTPAWRLTPSSVMQISIGRQLSVFDTNSVVVKSWNCWDGQAYPAGTSGTQTAAEPTAVSENGSGPGTLVVLLPNLSDESAIDTGRLIQSTSAFGQGQVEIRMPGETNIRVGDTIILGEMDLALDLSCTVIGIRRSFSGDRGFTQTVRGTMQGAL